MTDPYATIRPQGMDPGFLTLPDITGSRIVDLLLAILTAPRGPVPDPEVLDTLARIIGRLAVAERSGLLACEMKTHLKLTGRPLTKVGVAAVVFYLESRLLK